jgi:hypothetical protein
MYVGMREVAPTGVRLFGFHFLRGVSVALDDRPAALAGGLLADGDYFSAMGVGMHVGRPIGAADDFPDAPLVSVLSHSFWARPSEATPTSWGGPSV